MTLLYSHNNARPEPLPFRITLPNGFTRTDPASFTAEEIADAGFTGPYTQPSYDPKVEVFDWNGIEYFIRPHNSQELEDQWKIIRTQRDQLLKDCDWTQISDYNFELENKEQWMTYRQELRDLPETQINPFDILWPIIPSILKMNTHLVTL
jgi:hypothetical protein